MTSVSTLAFSISQKRPNSLHPSLHTDIWGIKDLLINPIRGEIYVAASLPKWPIYKEREGPDGIVYWPEEDKYSTVLLPASAETTWLPGSCSNGYIVVLG